VPSASPPDRPLMIALADASGCASALTVDDPATAAQNLRAAVEEVLSWASAPIPAKILSPLPNEILLAALLRDVAEAGICKTPGWQSPPPNEARAFSRARGSVATVATTHFDEWSRQLHEGDEWRSHQTPRTAETDTVDKLIYILAEYANERMGLDMRIDIEGQLQALYASEALHYVTKEHYRDHLMHAVNVCILGLLLLRATSPGAPSLVERIAASAPPYHEMTPLGDAVARVYRDWMAASLLHDVGYRFELYNQLLSGGQPTRSAAIQQFESQLALAARENILALNDAALQRIRVDFQRGKINHGVVGCIELVSIIEKARDLNLQDYIPSLNAIARHHLFTEEIRVDAEPITWLLVLCDELQEWGRPRVRPARFSKAVATQLLFQNVTDLGRREDVESIESPLRWVTGAGWQLTATSPLRFTLRFQPSDPKEDFHPSILWLLKSHNFSRLIYPTNGSADFLRFQVTLDTPRQSTLRHKTELDMLVAFMREKQHWELRGWLKRLEETWRLEEDPADPKEDRETVLLSPDYLAQPACRLTQDPSDLFRDLVEYKRAPD